MECTLKELQTPSALFRASERINEARAMTPQSRH